MGKHVPHVSAAFTPAGELRMLEQIIARDGETIDETLRERLETFYAADSLLSQPNHYRRRDVRALRPRERALRACAGGKRGLFKSVDHKSRRKGARHQRLQRTVKRVVRLRLIQ